MLTTFATEGEEVWNLLYLVTTAFQPKSVGKVFYWELQPNQPKPVFVEMFGPHRTQPTFYQTVSTR